MRKNVIILAVGIAVGVSGVLGVNHYKAKKEEAKKILWMGFPVSAQPQEVMERGKKVVKPVINADSRMVFGIREDGLVVWRELPTAQPQPPAAPQAPAKK